MLSSKTIEMMKWVGTLLVVLGVALNVLNNPELQEYVYPNNLYINLLGGFLLLAGALVQRDWQYVALNTIVSSTYVFGVINVFYPLTNLFS